MLKEADPQLLLALKILLLFEFKALHTASLLTDHLVFFFAEISREGVRR
ncbi:hypothetical protein C5S32_07390 [ANME-1 cluster archaeon GoMg1]|nr:hypothetical protein [ANME-1 cluster archaeon GoMg1]